MTLTTIGTRGRAGAVRRATDEETPELTGALARVLAHDPVMSWLVRHEANRPGRLERMLGELFLKPAMAYRSAYTTGDRAGAALWIPPGKGRFNAAEKLGLVPLVARVTGFDLPRALRVLSGMKSRRPQEPHWYLSVLGLEPGRQGQELDGALLQPVLDRCDTDGLGAYVEATTPRNRDLHLRQGFALLNEIDLPGGGPPLWLMWRGPAPA